MPLFLGAFHSSVYISIQFELHWPVQSYHWVQWSWHFIDSFPYCWDRGSLLIYIQYCICLMQVWCSILVCRLLDMLVYIASTFNFEQDSITSHCVCFHYIVICSVSSAYSIGVISFAWSRCICCGLWTGHYSGYLFPALFANQILICFMPVAHVSPVPPSLHYSVLADFGQVIVLVSLFLALLLTRHWFVQCQQHLYIRVIL